MELGLKGEQHSLYFYLKKTEVIKICQMNQKVLLELKQEIV
jgi:hypothetical protein